MRVAGGEILAHDESMQVTSMLDIRLKLLKHSHRELANWTRLRLYHGTKEILCRLVLLDKESLAPGEECFAQLRLEEPTACKYGDPFVIRFYSPLETIGGGTILDPNAHKHKRFKQDILDELLFKAAGDQDAIVDNLIRKHSDQFINIDEVVKLSGLTKEEVIDQVTQLKTQEVIIEISRQVLLHKEFLLTKEQEMLKLLSDYHEKYPIRLGLPKEELRSKLFSNIKNKVLDEVLLQFGNVIKIEGKFVSYIDFEITYSPAQQRSIDEMIQRLTSEAFKPSNMSDLLKSQNDKHMKDILINLVESGQLIKINDAIYLTKAIYEKALSLLKSAFADKAGLSLSECRDILDTSRKYIVPIMEYFDGKGITKRVGDERMLR